MICGEFKSVRFEISQDGSDASFTRFEVPSDRLCQCTRELLVSSVLGKPLRTLRLDAIAFALGAGYEAFPEYVHRLLTQTGQSDSADQAGKEASAEHRSIPDRS